MEISEIDLLKELKEANIELRKKIKKYSKANHLLTKKNSKLQGEISKLREQLREYGMGRHNQHINKKNTSVKIKPYQIQSIVENYCDVPFKAIFSDDNNRKFVFAKQLYVYFLRKHTPLSLKKIGRDLKRDHTTIIYAEQKIKQLIVDADPKFMKLHDTIENKIQETITLGKYKRSRQKKLQNANNN